MQRSKDIQIEMCPVLKPTEEEFEDFFLFMEKVEKQYHGKYGMVKVPSFNIQIWYMFNGRCLGSPTQEMEGSRALR
jgi:hypothetical protein